MANPFFDAAYYLAQNPDVEAAFGNDAAAAEAHYIANGADEGRKPAQWFDAAYYQSNNADLAGLAPNELFEHFANYGVNELRSPSEGLQLDAATFQAYAAANEDLRNAFEIEDAENLTDEQVAALANHFFAHGIHEGREGAPVVPDEPVDLGELTEAVIAYQDAVAEKEAFLADAAENEVIASILEVDAEDPENPTDGEIEEAIGDAVETAQSNFDILLDATEDDALNAAAEIIAEYPYQFEGASADLTAAMIAEIQEFLQEKADDANEAVDKVSGLRKAINNLLVSEDRLNDAEDATDDKLEALNGAAGQFNGVNGTTITLEFDREFDGTVSDGSTALIEANEETGKLELTDAAKNAEPAYKGLNELLKAAQDAANAIDFEGIRQADFDKKELEVKKLENPDATDTELETATTPLYDALSSALEDLETFGDAVADYESVVALEAGLAEHEDAIDAASDGIAELGFNFIPFEGADSIATATEADDVFAYIPEVEGLSIDLFGAEGNDVFYIGTQFEFGGNDIAEGDASALEVFLTQDGDNVVVTVEHTPFGTNAADQEIDTITLVGVSIDDIQFADGYVQLV